jgi:hypothetical protein
MTIQFFWNNKLISKHETKEEAFKQALSFMKDQNFGFWEKYSCSFLDTTDQESESRLYKKFDDWIWDNWDSCII